MKTVRLFFLPLPGKTPSGKQGVFRLAHRTCRKRHRYIGTGCYIRKGRLVALKRESWEELAAVDIRTVDMEELVDITTLEKDLSGEDPAERFRLFLQAVKNPYCFRVGEMAVKSSFSGNVSLQQRIQEIVDGI